MRTIDNKFEIGDLVYIVTDTEQEPGLIICIEVYQGDLLYRVAQGHNNDSFYDFELSREKNEVLKFT